MIHQVSDATTYKKNALPALFGSNTSSANVELQKWAKASTDAVFDIQQIQGAENSLTIHSGTWSLYTQIQHIDERISEMFECLQQIRLELSQRPLSSTILIHDLGNKSLKVVRPISVVLNETDEESLARWPETRASGIGSTLGEAISELKKNVSFLYFDLKSRPLESLSDIAIDTLDIFETHLQIIK